jgi:hypothetical protein
MLPLRREELTSDEDPQLSGAAMNSVYSPASSTCPLLVAGCWLYMEGLERDSTWEGDLESKKR